jgi:hypothetical protein
MKILFLQENNKIALVSPNPQVSLETVMNDLPKDRPMITVEDSDLPPSDDLAEFFDALTVNFSNSSIGFNMDAAREITKQRLRKQREPIFTRVDIAIRDAMLEQNSTALNDAIAERNRLRDVTKLAESANDLASLRSIVV